MDQTGPGWTRPDQDGPGVQLWEQPDASREMAVVLSHSNSRLKPGGEGDEEVRLKERNRKCRKDEGRGGGAT